MSWEVEKYDPPKVLEEDLPAPLNDKPMAMVHEVIRRCLNKSTNQDVSVNWILNRTQKIILNSPSFAKFRRDLMSSNSGFRDLRAELKSTIYHNLALNKIPHSRQIVHGPQLFRIAEDCEWYICVDKRTLEELEVEFDEVIVLERRGIDIRLVKPNQNQKQGAVYWYTILNQSRETPNPMSFIESVWDENMGNHEQNVPSDRLRHYCPNQELDVPKFENRIGRSFERNAPIDGWPTAEASLIYDFDSSSSINSEYAYGLAYDPNLNYSWWIEGWSISKWKIDRNNWPLEPEIRHLGIVNGQKLINHQQIYDVMRSIRTRLSEVNLDEALDNSHIGWDLPRSRDSPTSHHSYWLEVARALHRCNSIDKGFPKSMLREIFRRTGWEVVN